MNSLFILQFACCIACTMMMTVLACSGFLIRHRRRRYEVSRWLLCACMFLLATHYILQMKHGLRVSGDDVGTVVNLLFYSPAEFLFFYAIYNVECARAERKPYLWCGIGIYALIVTAFFIGRSATGTLHIGNMLYVMLALFVVGTIAAIIVNARIIIERRKMLETQTGIDMAIYDRFAMSSFFVVGGFTVLMPIAMVYRPLLFVIGPILLIALFIFVLCFIALGYNVDTVSDMAESPDVIDDSSPLPEERVADIEAALEKWCSSGGYRNSAASVVTVADVTGVPRKELALYFRRTVRTTFRAWLSDVRFERAKQMLMDNSKYSIDAISEECGFASHTQLYRLFKVNTGMSPGQWRNSLS